MRISGSIYEVLVLRGIPAWTLKHGHFLIMGGIHLVEPFETAATHTASPVEGTKSDAEKGGAPGNSPDPEPEGRVTILTFEMLQELVKDKEFRIRITEEDITRRSKRDGLSKIIFILQTSWFILQCLARLVQGLRITQLELTTLALASLNGITSILWWNKPLGAEAVWREKMKRQLTDKERNVVENVSNFFTIAFVLTCSLQRGRSERSKFIKDMKGFFTKCVNTRAWLKIPPAILGLLLFPIIAFATTFYYTIKDLVLRGSTSFPADVLHVPTFYVPKHLYLPYHLDILLLMVFGTLFGAHHKQASHSSTLVVPLLYLYALIIATHTYFQSLYGLD